MLIIVEIMVAMVIMVVMVSMVTKFIVVKTVIMAPFDIMVVIVRNIMVVMDAICFYPSFMKVANMIDFV